MAGRRGAFIWRILLHHVENPPEKPADWLGVGGGGTLCIWLGLAHFHNGYSFLMISPNLLARILFGSFSLWNRAFLMVFSLQVMAILRWAAKNSFRGTPRLPSIALYWAPMLLKFDFTADPDPDSAFHSNACPASPNNANPDLKLCSRQCSGLRDLAESGSGSSLLLNLNPTRIQIQTKFFYNKM